MLQKVCRLRDFFVLEVCTYASAQRPSVVWRCKYENEVISYLPDIYAPALSDIDPATKVRVEYEKYAVVNYGIIQDHGKPLPYAVNLIYFKGLWSVQFTTHLGNYEDLILFIDDDGETKPAIFFPKKKHRPNTDTTCSFLNLLKPVVMRNQLWLGVSLATPDNFIHSSYTDIDEDCNEDSVFAVTDSDEIIPRLFKTLGWQSCLATDPRATIIWIEYAALTQELYKILPNGIRLNSFPGEYYFGCKENLNSIIQRMKSILKDDSFFSFFPESFCTPKQNPLIEKFLTESKKNGKKVTLIAKPSDGSLSKGIFLFDDPKDIPNGFFVVQRFIDNPCVIKKDLIPEALFPLANKKFDIRIFLLITSVDPVRAFAFTDGLCRFVKDEMDPSNSLNLSSGILRPSEAGGFVMSLKNLKIVLEKMKIDFSRVWNDITSKLGKLVVCVAPLLKWRKETLVDPSISPYAFYGVDLMLDADYNPIIFEVNDNPSLTEWSICQDTVDSALLDAFKLVSCKKEDQFKHEDSTVPSTGYEMIVPFEGSDELFRLASNALASEPIDFFIGDTLPSSYK